MTSYEKTFHFMKKPWVIALYVVLVVLVYLFVDRPIAIYFHQLDLRAHAPILNLLTALGKWTAYVVIFVFAGLYFRYIRKNSSNEVKAWYLLACILIPNLVALIVKIALSRARPELLFSSHYYGFYWFKLHDLYWSFPSAHAVTITALASGLGVLIPRYFYLFLVVALLVACSRVLLYYHYLSDVMTGFYLSLLVVGIFTSYFKKKYKDLARS